MAHGVLHVPQRHAADQSCGAERPSQGVGAELLAQASSARQAPQPAGCRSGAEPFTVPVTQQRPGAASLRGVADSAQNRHGQRDQRGLGALAHDGEQFVPSLAAQVRDVDPDGFTDAQADHAEQRDERMGVRAVAAGRGQQRGVLKRVQHRAPLSFPRHARPGNGQRRVLVAMPVNHGVAEEARNSGEATADGGRREAPLLQPPQVQLQMRTLRLQRLEVPVGAPAQKDPQILGVGAQRVAAVAGQKAQRGQLRRIGLPPLGGKSRVRHDEPPRERGSNGPRRRRRRRAESRRYIALVPSASEDLTLELQVGRVLRGRLLALAVLLRQLPSMLLDGFGSGHVAPAWVVVRERVNGEEVLRVSAGREPGAGELILSTMRQEAGAMDRDSFVARWMQRR